MTKIIGILTITFFLPIFSQAELSMDQPSNQEIAKQAFCFDSAGGVIPMPPGGCPNGMPPFLAQLRMDCEDGYVRDPRTGQCLKITGKIIEASNRQQIEGILPVEAQGTINSEL